MCAPQFTCLFLGCWAFGSLVVFGYLSLMDKGTLLILVHVELLGCKVGVCLTH